MKWNDIIFTPQLKFFTSVEVISYGIVEETRVFRKSQYAIFIVSTYILITDVSYFLLLLFFKLKFFLTLDLPLFYI